MFDAPAVTASSHNCPHCGDGPCWCDCTAPMHTPFLCTACGKWKAKHDNLRRTYRGVPCDCLNALHDPPRLATQRTNHAPGYRPAAIAPSDRV